MGLRTGAPAPSLKEKTTAAAVPGATLHPIGGMGQEIPAGARPWVVAAIEAHTWAHSDGARSK